MMRRAGLLAFAWLCACSTRTFDEPIAVRFDDGWQPLEPVWAVSLPTMFPPYQCPVLADGSVFASAGYGYGRFDAASGAAEWWNAFPPTKVPVVGDLALGHVDGALVVANLDDYIVSVDIRDGGLIAERRFNGRNWTAASDTDAGRQNGHYWLFDAGYTRDSDVSANRLLAVGQDLEPEVIIPAPGMAAAEPFLDDEDGLIVGLDYSLIVAYETGYTDERWRVETHIAGARASLDHTMIIDEQHNPNDYYGDVRLRAFHTANGALAWTTARIPGAGPIIAGSGVVVAAHWRTKGGYSFVKDDSVVWRVSSATGEVLGTTDLPSHPYLLSEFARTPDGLLFTTHGDGYFVIDETDGTVVYSTTFRRPEDWVDTGSLIGSLCPPALLDEGILVVLSDGIALLPYPEGIGVGGRK